MELNLSKSSNLVFLMSNNLKYRLNFDDKVKLKCYTKLINKLSILSEIKLL